MSQNKSTLHVLEPVSLLSSATVHYKTEQGKDIQLFFNHKCSFSVHFSTHNGYIRHGHLTQNTSLICDKHYGPQHSTRWMACALSHSTFQQFDIHSTICLNHIKTSYFPEATTKVYRSQDKSVPSTSASEYLLKSVCLLISSDRWNNGKITLKSGLALNGIYCYRKLRTARSGGSWL